MPKLRPCPFCGGKPVEHYPVGTAYSRRVMSSVKLHGIAALLALIIVALGVVVAAIASDAVPREEDAQAVATDSAALVEGRASCPSCGAETWAVNGEIACRNEECGAYGLPVVVSGVDQQVF